MTNEVQKNWTFYSIYYIYINKNQMGRPTITDKKKTLSLSINIELDELLDKVCEEKNINKSKYIEYLIKKDIDNKKPTK